MAALGLGGAQFEVVFLEEHEARDMQFDDILAGPELWSVVY